MTLVILAALAAACASGSVPPASDRLTRQAESLTPPPGKAGVYVIRGAAHPADQALWAVDLDFAGFGTVGADSYLYGWVSPGQHVLVVVHDGQVYGRARFHAREVRNYFFMVEAGLLALHIERIDERSGRALVARSTLSGDNRFEADPLPPAAARERR
jgi:hypothetical protein